VSRSAKLHLFEGYGVELEYMIVNAKDLSVVPLADQVLEAQAGALVNEVEVGQLCWSNELVLHLIELKTNGPASFLNSLAAHFQEGVAQVNKLLAPLGAKLMPSSMHPWMNPLTETKLWPYGDSSIYAAYDRIFGCQGHGWSNVQSAHLNLPFQGDHEFARLHAAIRLVLPLLPALAASSPFIEGRHNGLLDNRLRAYQQNQRRIPIITGSLIPEAVFSKETYQSEILQPIYTAIAPWDPAGILQYEWLNSRGAIARFDRNSIEIRLLDIQECPQADLAIIELIIAVLKSLVEERWCSYEEQQNWSLTPLAKWLTSAIGDGDRTRIDSAEYLSLFGYARNRASMGELWHHLALALRPNLIAKKDCPLTVILNQGPLARRIYKATGSAPNRKQLWEVYTRLSSCLANGDMFLA